MAQIKYKEFVEKYKPIKNHLFPNAILDGYLYRPDDLVTIKDYLFAKRIWSLVTDAETNYYTMQEELSYKLVPGADALSAGYVVTSVPFEVGDNTEVLLPSKF